MTEPRTTSRLQGQGQWLTGQVIKGSSYPDLGFVLEKWWFSIIFVFKEPKCQSSDKYPSYLLPKMSNHILFFNEQITWFS
jgi:hypothetical protein